MASVSWAAIRADLRTLLTTLSLNEPPKPLPPEMTGRVTFGTDAWIIPGIVEWGVMRGAWIAHVQREVDLKRGINVAANLDPDEAYDAAVAAQEAIIKAFLSPVNQPNGVFHIGLIDGVPFDETDASHWIIEIRIRVEYAIDIPSS